MPRWPAPTWGGSSDSKRDGAKYPPADGWPVRLFNSKFKLNVKQGINATANRQIRRPIMVYIRESYDGNRDFRLATAFQNMVDNLKDYGV